MKKKILFIVNPISGGIDKKGFPDLVWRVIDQKKFDVEIRFTESEQHNLLLAENAVKSRKDIVIAAGGDGTINHVAKYLANTGILFGIIPQGSGNGLARHLGIPMNDEKALGLINDLHTKTLDAGMADDVFFINVAGAGFDAHVSWMFANASRRGFWSYTKITLKEFAKYKPQEYELTIDGKTVKPKAFILCVANGSQYGNNAYIAPQARTGDGIFDISIIKPFNVFMMPLIGLEMFMKKFGNSRYIDTYSGREITIRRKEEGVFNIDGEPVMMGKNITIKMLPGALNVIVPR